jgi:xanthine/CO dehydrogenase XdhC/CoxF family maturation factor
MKEIKSIINAYNAIDFSNTRAALATVARVEGSSYRRTGARMLVLDNGTYLGGISGGCLEGDALRRAQKAIAQKKPSIVTYDTTEDDDAQIGVGLGCNGIIDVLFTPLDGKDENNPVKIISTLTETREPKIVVAITGGPDESDLLGKTILYENDEQFARAFPIDQIVYEVLNDIHHCLNKQTSATLTYKTAKDNEIKIFIEVIMPVTHLVLYGGNYDVYPLVRVAKELGWNITVVMNIHKADRSLFTTANQVLHSKGEERPLIDNYTAIILMAHDYKTDFNNLQYTLTTKAKYIGLLGPRKRTQKMFDEMDYEGNPVSQEDMQRIFSPAGLDIGATTPEEIALSICAEIRSVFANRRGMSLRLREGTIHGN